MLSVQRPGLSRGAGRYTPRQEGQHMMDRDDPRVSRVLEPLPDEQIAALEGSDEGYESGRDDPHEPVYPFDAEWADECRRGEA